MVAAFLLANFALVQIVLMALHAPYEDTGLAPIAWFFEGRQGHDSWDSMVLGYEHVTPSHSREPFYWRTFFSPQIPRKGFQYPPTALLIVSALSALVGKKWLLALRAITWAMVPVTALLVWALYEALRPRAPPRSGERLLAAAVAAFATVTFYPIMRAYANGQIQASLNALFAGALWCWATDRRAWSGVLLALSCAVKPQLGVFMLWGILRRRWSFVAAFGLTAATMLAVSVALYGFGPHREYLGVLRFLARRGEAFYPNQSVNGLVNRWLFNGDILAWRLPWIDHFPPYDTRVFAATAASSLVLLLMGLWGPLGEGHRADVVDFAVMALVGTMASPIAWEHHYGVLLPIFVAAWLTGASRPSRPARAALMVSYVLVSNCLWVTRSLAGSRLNVLESYLFFGAIVLLVVLLRWRAGGESEDLGYDRR